MKSKLTEIKDTKKNWKEVKDVKMKKMPKFTKQKDMHGKRVPYQKLAEKTAEYLEQVQWKAPPENTTEKTQKISKKNH